MDGSSDGRPVLVDTLAASAAVRRPAGTIRRWASAGLLERKGSDPRRRALYDLAAVYRVAGQFARKGK